MISSHIITEMKQAVIQNQTYRQLYQVPINSTKDDVISAVSFLSLGEAICRSCYFCCWCCNTNGEYFLQVDSYPSLINLLIVSDVKSPSLAEIVS